MKILGTYDVRVMESNPLFKPSWYHINLSSGGVATRDRGANSDQFTSSIIVRGDKDTIYNIYNKFNRITSTFITDVNSGERLFGDTIDYENSNISVGVNNLGSIEQITYKTYQLAMDMMLDMDDSSLVYLGNPVLPQSLCVRNNNSIDTEMGTIVRDTYNGELLMADSRNDKYIANLSLIMKLDEAINFQRWYRENRGVPFTMTQAQWGIENPFGVDCGDYPYLAVITDMNVSANDCITRGVDVIVRKMP